MQVNGFYLKRRSVLKVMRHIIADELMVPWESGLPTGGLPNIAFEPRKPEALGTRFKCLLDNDTKVMSTLEICEGKERNRELASNTPGQQRRDHFDNSGRRTCTDAHRSGGVPAA